MIQKTSAPIGYGSVSSVAGPNGNPLFMPHHTISGQAAKQSTASPKNTQATMPIHRFKARLRFDPAVKKSPAGKRGEAPKRVET